MRDKIKWLWSFYRNYRYVLAVLIILTPLQVAFQVSIPRLIEFTVDFVKTGEIPDNSAARMVTDYGSSMGLSPEAAFAMVLVLFGLCASVLYAFVQSHRAWMNVRLEWLFRQFTFDKITRLGPDFFNRFRTGDLVTRMTDDVEQKLSWFACSGVFRFYEALVMVIFTLTMMIIIDPMLTLFSAGPLPILILIFFKSASRLDKRYDNLQKRISDFNDVMEACFSGIRVVKSYVREKAQKSVFGDVATERKAAEISTVKTMTIVDSLYMYIWQVGIVIVLIAGGYMVINSGLSLGKLVAFIYYVVYLVFPMFDIGQFLVKSRQSAVSIDRLTELTEVEPMVRDNGGQPVNGHTEGRISFKDVTFFFPGSDHQIINDISLDIEAGETVAFVGKIGAGKTWLINLLPRLVDPVSGSVELDGRNLKELKLGKLREYIGYVPQEPILYSDTIRNNILMGRDHISNEIVNWAVDVSQLKDEIETFPKGLETYVGTKGVSLSGGQKQRLALARALAGKPKVLILDDCTSALDSSTEANLWGRLHEVMPNMTALLITHRPDTLESVDRIYVLEDGRVSEVGTHKELIERGKQYSRIYRRYQLNEQVAS